MIVMEDLMMRWHLNYLLNSSWFCKLNTQQSIIQQTLTAHLFGIRHGSAVCPGFKKIDKPWLLLTRHLILSREERHFMNSLYLIVTGIRSEDCTKWRETSRSTKGKDYSQCGFPEGKFRILQCSSIFSTW